MCVPIWACLYRNKIKPPLIDQKTDETQAKPTDHFAVNWEANGAVNEVLSAGVDDGDMFERWSDAEELIDNVDQIVHVGKCIDWDHRSCTS